MNDEMFIKKIVKNLQQENKELKKQFEELEKQNSNLRKDIMLKKITIPYEEIKDKSLYDLYDMPSYSDLDKQIQKLEGQLKIKHNGFMASVDESCELARENQKYKEVIDKLNVKLNQYKNDLKVYQKQDTINHRAISIGLIGVKIRAFEDILKEAK